jgi:hypothetical protein
LTVPVELLVWALGAILVGIGALISFCVHLLIAISSNLAEVKASAGIRDERITTLEKTVAKIEDFTLWARRRVRLAEDGPQTGHEAKA